MAFFCKGKKFNWSGSWHFTSGDERAYLFIHQTFTGELREVTRVLYCQESIFIIIKKNDYSKAVEITLLCEENLKNFAQLSSVNAKCQRQVTTQKEKYVKLFRIRLV